jgi:SAM-dependent methyltransferase
MTALWTVDGDETSWTEWAERMAESPSSPLVDTLLSSRQGSPGAWALDVGCGTGRAFNLLIQRGFQVIGIDPTAAAVRAAAARAAAEPLPAWAILGAADHPPIKEQSIDLVLALGVLFHLNAVELQAALTQIHAVLRPGGEAILHFLDIDDWRRMLGAVTPPADLPQPSYKAVVTCFCSSDAVRESLAPTGLTLVSLELVTQEHEAGELRNWLAVCTR